MLDKTSGFLNNLKSYFDTRLFARSRIVEDLAALDEMKEIINISSSWLKYVDPTRDENNDVNLSTKKIISNLENTPSLYFDNAMIAFRKLMPEQKKIIREYTAAMAKYKPKKENIESLVISGGGGKGQFYLGALQELEKEGVLNNIKTFAGTSAGALTSIPLSLGCKTTQIEDIMKNTDFRTFMIEGRSYNTKEKRAKQKLKGLHLEKKDTKLNEIEKVTHIINAFKVGIEGGMDGYDDKEYKNSNRLKFFFNIPLDKPLKTSLSIDKFSELLEEIWESRSVRSFCAEIKKNIHEQTGSKVFKSPKDVLKLGLSFALEMDYVEYYFGKIIHERLSLFVEKFGQEKLTKIIPRMSDKSNWADLSMAEIGQLARSAAGKEFGFRDLVIGVTKTSKKDQSTVLSAFLDKITGGASIINFSSNLINQVVKTRGILVSSNIQKSEDTGLSHAPIKTLARMSMSIPFEFNPKRYGNAYYVDGGLHHNLATKYFDSNHKNNFDPNLLAIIPFTGGEIEVAKTVQDGFKITEQFSVSVEPGIFGIFKPKTIKSFLNEIKKKGVSALASYVTYTGNQTYQKMGVRESFRNIIIDTGKYSTLSFSASEDDFKSLNDISQKTVSGIDFLDPQNKERTSLKSSGIFDPGYNSLVRLYEFKLLEHYKKDPALYLDAIKCHNKNIEQAKKEGRLIVSKKCENAIKSFIQKTAVIEKENLKNQDSNNTNNTSFNII